MLTFLAKRFIKNYENTGDREVRAAYGTLSSVVGILANLLLVAIKMAAGVLSGSVSVVADALNNLSDAGSSGISFLSFKISAKPADRDHPYGHARMEYVTSMLVSMIILFLGFELFKTSLSSLADPAVQTTVSFVTAGALALAILGKILLALFYFSAAKKIDSDVMRAAGTDSLSDVLSSAAVLLGILVQIFFPNGPFTPYVDGAGGILVSVLIFLAGLKILNETKNHILGEAPDKEPVERLCAIVRTYPECLGIHDLTVHQYGPGVMIASLHVEVDGSRNMFDIHDAIDNMENEVERETGILCTIHTDPVAVDEDTTSVRDQMAEKLREIDPRLSLHDFRMVRGITHSNLVFDVAQPFECTLSPDELRQSVGAKAREIDERYCVVIHIDRS